MFTETLDALGSWELELAAETPADTITQLTYLGHLVVVEGEVDVEATGNGLLAVARYVGVCRAKATPGTHMRSGSGLLFWLGDEDGKGHTILTEISLTSATLAQVVTALLPPTVTVRTVHPQANPATRYTGKHVFQSRRDALAIAFAPFGAEIRVNGDFSVDVGTPEQLYDTALPLTSKPSPMIVRKGAGSDIDLLAVGGKVETEGAIHDFSTDVTLLGQTVGTGDDPGTLFATGSASASTVAYKDPQGAPFKSVRLISESGETTGSVAMRSQLQLNRFNREASAIRVTADDFDIAGGFGVGDATYVYDPDSGILDTANPLIFRGETVFPQIIRVTSLTTPIVEGMTVAWRTDAGVWLDLTRWVVWESAGSREVTVGDRPRSLTRPSDPIQDRVDAGRGGASTKAPKTPTGLSLSTSSAISPKGTDAAVITATWSAVTQYVDDTTVALSHYEVQRRPVFRAPLWEAGQITAATTVVLPVVAALSYDVRVRAWSTGGVPSAWSATASITSAADTLAPNPPADPVVTSYLGQLRIEYAGTDSAGNPMTSDTNRIDVHVGTTSGFTATTATRVDSITPFAKGVSYATAPYSLTDNRWVRLIAVDHSGNPSASSAAVGGRTVQVADGDIAAMSVGKLTAGVMTADVVISGRFTTALTGARSEVNAIGFQAWDASEDLTISLDGVDNLLTGRFRTALTGRRIELGNSGTAGEINFYAPDNTRSRVRAWTSGGYEGIQLGVPVTGAHGAWGAFQAQANEVLYAAGRMVTAIVGGATTGARGFTVEYAPEKALLSEGAGRRALFTVFPDSIDAYFSSTGRFTVWERSTAGDFTSRIYVDPQYVKFGFVTGFPNGGGSIFLRPPDEAVTSPAVQLLTAHGYGVRLKTYYNAGDGAPLRFEVRSALDTGWSGIWAAFFTVQSDADSKEKIRDYGGSLAKLRAAKVKRYLRKSTDGTTQVEEIGLLAQEAPAELVTGTALADDGSGLGINLYSLAAMNTAAIQELADQLDELRKVKR